MTRRRRTALDATGADPSRAVVLYADVAQEADDALRAEAATDLTRELVLLRRLLHEQIGRDPDSLSLTIKAMHLLVRMVTAQHNLTRAEAADLSEATKQVMEEFARNIMGVEAEDD
jgi:hypothetical protein